jgi:hypothetical protein
MGNRSGGSRLRSCSNEYSDGRMKIILIEKDAITVGMIVERRLPILSTYTFCFSRFESTSVGANCKEKSLKCDSATSGSQVHPMRAISKFPTKKLLFGETTRRRGTHQRLCPT